jgi:hypothetical protein
MDEVLCKCVSLPFQFISPSIAMLFKLKKDGRAIEAAKIFNFFVELMSGRSYAVSAF